MALPINVRELIESRVVESTRVEYKSDSGAKQIDRTCRNHGTCPYCKENRNPTTMVDFSHEAAWEQVRALLIGKGLIEKRLG